MKLFFWPSQVNGHFYDLRHLVQLWRPFSVTSCIFKMFVLFKHKYILFKFLFTGFEFGGVVRKLTNLGWFVRKFSHFHTSLKGFILHCECFLAFYINYSLILQFSLSNDIFIFLFYSTIFFCTLFIYSQCIYLNSLVSCRDTIYRG